MTIWRQFRTPKVSPNYPSGNLRLPKNPPSLEPISNYNWKLALNLLVAMGKSGKGGWSNNYSYWREGHWERSIFMLKVLQGVIDCGTTRRDPYHCYDCYMGFMEHKAPGQLVFFTSHRVFEKKELIRSSRSFFWSSFFSCTLEGMLSHFTRWYPLLCKHHSMILSWYVTTGEVLIWMCRKVSTLEKTILRF